jgi:Protein of unknown function (DUF1326)
MWVTGRFQRRLYVGCLTLVVAVSLGDALRHTVRAASTKVAGRLLEACSCSVPCPCNFGRHPSPHGFCDSVAIFQFRQGEMEGVDLRGLRFSIAERSGVAATLYLDPRLSTVQRKALRRIAAWVLTSDGTPLVAVLPGTTTVEFGASNLTGSVEGARIALKAVPLTGNDGRSGITVSYPWIFGSFPVKASRKAVAERLLVVAPELSFTYSNTNANDADFEFLAEQVP